MSETTKIEWADATFNPWIGCTKVSAGCANCYAEKTTRARVLRKQGQETWGKGAKRSRTSAANWRKPVMWNRHLSQFWEAAARYDGRTVNRPRVFPSLCDWLDDEVPIEWLADFLKLIHDTPNLDWLLLTKRPENWATRIIQARNYLTTRDAETALWLHDWLPKASMPGGFIGKQAVAYHPGSPGIPPANVWFGVSVENQDCANERVPLLLSIPAKVRFVSAEPLLGQIWFSRILLKKSDAPERGKPDVTFDALAGWNGGCDRPKKTKIDWVIFGGESGHDSRSCRAFWILQGLRECQQAGVKAYVKQLGRFVTDQNNSGFDGEHPHEWPMGTNWRELESTAYQGAPVEVLLHDSKGGDMSEWPEALRVREFPKL